MFNIALGILGIKLASYPHIKLFFQSLNINIKKSSLWTDKIITKQKTQLMKLNGL